MEKIKKFKVGDIVKFDLEVATGYERYKDWRAIVIETKGDNNFSIKTIANGWAKDLYIFYNLDPKFYELAVSPKLGNCNKFKKSNCV